MHGGLFKERMRYDRTVIAYHGCDAETAERLLAGDSFKPSVNDFDWLGQGDLLPGARPRSRPPLRRGSAAPGQGDEAGDRRRAPPAREQPRT